MIRTFLSWLRGWFRRVPLVNRFTDWDTKTLVHASPTGRGLTAATAAPHIRPRPKKNAKARTRARLRALLKRPDQGGKHYGSKRAESTHRGSQQGKRSGRQ